LIFDYANDRLSKKTKNLSLSWVGSSQEDTADVVLSNLDISIVSPRGRPGVLDEEIVNTVLSTITDSEDTVVKIGSAILGEDT
jgi:hypothetical protein